MVREVFIELVEEFKSKMSVTSILELFGIPSLTSIDQIEAKIQKIGYIVESSNIKSSE